MVKRMHEDDVTHRWDRNAEDWAEAVAKGRDVINDLFGVPAFLEFIGDIAGRKILDAGCGEGRSSRALAAKGAAVTGLDISSRMIDLARREEACAPLGIEYRQGSFSDLSDFEDGTFDGVVSVMALMDAADFEGALKEFERILRPGGELAFSLLHPCFYTRGLGYVRDAKGGRARLTVSDYFAEAAYLDRWRFPGQTKAQGDTLFKVPRFPRTVSQYLNGIIDVGLVLAGVLEPRASEEVCRRFPPLDFWRRHGALYLYVRAAKPA